MDKKKMLYLSVLGLLIIAVGAVVLLIMDFPIGLLIVLPSAVPHISNLYQLRKNSK